MSECDARPKMSLLTLFTLPLIFRIISHFLPFTVTPNLNNSLLNDLCRVRRYFLKKSGRQTDKQLLSKKTFEIAFYFPKFLFYYSETQYKSFKTFL